MSDDKTIARALLLRLKHIAFVIGGLIAVTYGALFITFGFMLLTALAFLGSTGRAADAFLMHFVPAGYFLEGALLCGGFVALISAVFASERLWFKAIAASAVTGGALVALIPGLGKHLNRLAEPGIAFMWKTLL